jgi:proteasome lid subunit RPN8/RPN11
VKSATEKYINSKNFDKHTMANIKMSHKAYKKIMNSICSRPAESGGILLGPVGTNEVTDFYFDRGANCSAVTYTPDHLTLSKKMKEEWLPAGIDMKGFVHSHPGLLDRLTSGDLSYIKRLLNKNTDMDMFIAPIVIPGEYRMRPMFVAKQNYYQPREARIELF